ncbi:hypothetical protein Anapl_07238 [Anas platyrhynchos]|uniref:Uncharacterized protein n=1 Tax=Anas platyrhynchos TaxID=8839 RepID=R0L910_ANAPL|nr:hypothetical protein Anapl_07238 [Anas platyrhynchos]
MQSGCIIASFFSAARGGLVLVQIAAIESGVSGSSLTLAVMAFPGVCACLLHQAFHISLLPWEAAFLGGWVKCDTCRTAELPGAGGCRAGRGQGTAPRRLTAEQSPAFVLYSVKKQALNVASSWLQIPSLPDVDTCS